jgi:hypothetical protein
MPGYHQMQASFFSPLSDSKKTAPNLAVKKNIFAAHVVDDKAMSA